jgi:hypothetical protein
MNREEILAMVPGRELDCIIAENVFNVKINKTISRLINEHVSMSISDVYGDENLEPIQDTTVKRIKDYSTDIAAAWEVVEKFDYNYLWRWDGVTRYAMPNGMKWECKFTEKGATSDNMGYGLTAPEAICKAALLAVMEVE